MSLEYKYKNSLAVFDMLEEILSVEEVVILGNDYTGIQIQVLLNECKKHGRYTESKAKLNSCLLEEKEESTYKLEKLSNLDNRNKVLITGTEYDRAGRDWIRLIKSGFREIIDGKLLLNCCYQPVFFRLLETPKKNSDSLASWAELLDKEALKAELPDDLKRRLCKGENDGRLFLAIAEHYRRMKEYQQAFDYCRMAENMSAVPTEDIEAFKVSFENTVREKELTEPEKIKMLNKLVDINYYGRSGSIYFQSLLEGHSDILSIPPGIIYYPYHKFYTLFCSHRGVVNVEELLEALDLDSLYVENYENCISLKVNNEGRIYSDSYRQKFLDGLKTALLEESRSNQGIVSEKFIIQAIHYVHNRALGREYDFKQGIPYILIQQHTNDSNMVLKIQSLFPYVMALFTIRDIVQNFGSILATYENNEARSLNPNKVLNLFIYYAFHPALTGVSKYRRVLLVPIEKLNMQPKEILSALVRHLGIRWEEILNESTLNGNKLYDSYGRNENYTNGPRVSGIQKNYSQYFDSFDRFRLEALYYPVLKRWKYPFSGYHNPDILVALALEPFRFEEHLQFQTENERLGFRKKIQRIYQSVISRQGEMEAYLENTEVL